MFCPNVINAILCTLHICARLWRDLKQLKRCKKAEETATKSFRYWFIQKKFGINVEHCIYTGFEVMLHFAVLLKQKWQCADLWWTAETEIKRREMQKSKIMLIIMRKRDDSNTKTPLFYALC